jgi:hypothetical protein
MTASKLNPTPGTVRSQRLIVKNSKPASASSPQFKGKIYLVGVGWYWISGWSKDTSDGPLLRLRAQEMTDEQAAKFCKPRPITREKGTAPRTKSAPNPSNGSANTTDDIPF